MTTTRSLPSSYGSTRTGLHRIANHILARRRYGISGRFGLRASPGGITTPAFGAGPEAVRVAGLTLVREVAGASTHIPIVGSTLRDLAVFTDVDLDTDFSGGDDAPPLGDVDVPIDADVDSAEVIADWYDVGWRVLDGVTTGLTADAAPATIQLWPEHFDAATNVGLASGERVNLGFSPGDAFEAEPYAYVGPWSSQRPGDPSFWNAPFGAVLRWSEAHASAEPIEACSAFMLAGLRHSSGS